MEKNTKRPQPTLFTEMKTKINNKTNQKQNCLKSAPGTTVFKLRVFTQQHMGIQHAHSNTHTDMNVFIEYVSVITAWQNYTYTQRMHNNTWNRNTSQREKTQIRFFEVFFIRSGKKKNFL